MDNKRLPKGHADDMSDASNPTPAEYRALQLSLLTKLDQKLDDMKDKLNTFAERVTKIEATDQALNIKAIQLDIDDHEVRLTKIETKSIVQNSIVAFIVSAIMGVVGMVLQSVIEKAT
jgi:hypothetical protein